MVLSQLLPFIILKVDVDSFKILHTAKAILPLCEEGMRGVLKLRRKVKQFEALRFSHF
jgi:hypothetical protein